MGFHVCEYSDVPMQAHGRFSNMSSGDVTLNFSSGRSWEMPDMILHYVADHAWLPPAEFIDDVMNHTYTGGSRVQTRGLDQPMQVGYLRGPFETGTVPDGFVDRLEELMQQAEGDGNRLQTKGLF